MSLGIVAALDETKGDKPINLFSDKALPGLLSSLNISIFVPEQSAAPLFPIFKVIVFNAPDLTVVNFCQLLLGALFEFVPVKLINVSKENPLLTLDKENPIGIRSFVPKLSSLNDVAFVVLFPLIIFPLSR